MEELRAHLVVCFHSGRRLWSMEERMNRNKTIDCVEFHADDLPATRQFYSQVFAASRTLVLFLFSLR
jgi:hypothetical protein